MRLWEIFAPTPATWPKKTKLWQVPTSTTQSEPFTSRHGCQRETRNVTEHAPETSIHDDHSLRAMQARQTCKIEQLREVFFANGRLSVKEQAELLGLCRSTAHAVLQRYYKKSGLSAAIIKRMLACPRLPERARTIILEYIAEKIDGSYGNSRSQRRRFTAALATEQNRDCQHGEGKEAMSADDAVDGSQPAP